MATSYVPLFWKYIFILVLTTLEFKQAAEGNLTFTCDVDGMITDIQKKDIPATKIAIEFTDGKYCHYSNTTCKEFKKKKLHVIIQSDPKPQLLAGKQVDIKHYNIECKDDFDVKGTAAPFKVSPSSVFPTAVSITKTPPILDLKIFKTKDNELTGNVLIGEKLTLQMTSSVYHVHPKVCTAINGDDSTETVDIWTYKIDHKDGTCSTFDSAITTQKWERSSSLKTTSITIYAFQFSTSPNVIISCSAHLCSSANETCSESCVNTITRRRKRSSQILNKKQPVTRTEEAHVSFRVVTESIVHNQANALNTSFTVLITAIILGKRLTRSV